MNKIYHKKTPDRKKKNVFFCFVFVFSVVLTFEVKECSRNLTFPSNTLSKKKLETEIRKDMPIGNTTLHMEKKKS